MYNEGAHLMNLIKKTFLGFEGYLTAVLPQTGAPGLSDPFLHTEWKLYFSGVWLFIGEIKPDIYILTQPK